MANLITSVIQRLRCMNAHKQGSLLKNSPNGIRTKSSENGIYKKAESCIEILSGDPPGERGEGDSPDLSQEKIRGTNE